VKISNKQYYSVLGACVVLAGIAILYNEQIKEQNSIYFSKPLSIDDLKQYSNTDPGAVVIYPVFTQKAYEKKGFYDYYNGTCGTCNVLSIKNLSINASYVEGLGGYDYLSQLHYGIITDIQVDQHPEILDSYDKIILLHNEYMTKTEFDAIKNHKNVIYLYPNAMYVEISVDYQKQTMSLVRGHGYPTKDILNGFDYVTSSQHEYDLNCKNYKWESRPNGIQPTCWPEFLIKSDRSVLQVIKDYPDKVPPLIESDYHAVNVTSLPKCDYYGNCK